MSHLKVQDLLPKDYGYVVLAVAGGSFLNARLAFRVTKARKDYGIQAPTMFSNENPVFNRIMRAHMDYLEHFPFYAVTVLLGGLEFPRVCATAGATWVIARAVYADIYTEDPSKRFKEFIPPALAQIVVIGCTVIFGLRQTGILDSLPDLISK
ncbi:glutathione S-transferase 3, mitochondrial-like [Watersipora subatra]|uniref:glutathione S-transferase 3, mitochondrial-like n=1 Tax=Watersipora subatra TaxID=2589382 RepID=UPI00355C4162